MKTASADIIEHKYKRFQFPAALLWGSMAWPVKAGEVGDAARTGGNLISVEQVNSTVSSIFQSLIALLEQAGSGPSEALSFGFLIAIMLFSLIAIGLCALTIRLAAQRGSTQKRRIRHLESELFQAKGLLAAEPSIVIFWRGSGDQNPTINGQLPDGVGAPSTHDELLNFEHWLIREDATLLSSSITKLSSVGKGFNIFLTSKTGTRLIAEGATVTGTATIKLRALSGSSLDVVINADRHADIIEELDTLKSLLSKTPILAWLRRSDGTLIWANDTYSQVIDAENGGNTVSDELELFPEEDHTKLQEIISHGGSARQRVHTVAKGERHTYDVICVPSAGGVSTVAIDVTQADQLSDQLDRLVAAHTRTLDQLATAVAIFGPDQKLNFFNASYIQQWQLDEDWLAQNPKDGEILDQLRDQGRLPEQADYRSWRTSRLSVYTVPEPVEDWWHLPDGQSLRVVIVPHPLGGVTHLYENVTEAIALASRYNALYSVQRETLDNLHEAVALFGSDGRIKLSNPSFARIWNIIPSELENEPHIDEVIAACRTKSRNDDYWEELRSNISAFGGERENKSGRIELSNGQAIAYASVPLPDGATLITCVDITDSWRIEQALRDRNEALLAADRLKAAFISHVSYELRAPLTNIIGFADLLAAKTFGNINEKQSEYIGYIQKSSQKLHQLINDILDLATIDAGVMELDSNKIDIISTLKAAGALLADRIEHAGLELIIDVPEDIGSLWADETRIKQILSNLLSNAIGFSPTGSPITIGALRDGEHVEIWVKDTGPGIAPDLLEKVFERFESHTYGTKHRGSGLGLSIVKSFVELHGGTATIESQLCEGTTVHIRLPIKMSSSSNEDKSEPDGLLQTNKNSRQEPSLDPFKPSN
jgi:signal transduction histidine kinase